MSGKVSMVMPCYNKVEDIGYMFDSIIAQDWDNIELILVNDGSTDGTREVISAYEPRFIARGYEVVIIDQENAGVCAAAVAGLKRVTGDYVCQIDSDDELDPKYVSTMAGWLEENPEYEFVFCEGVHYTGRGDSKVFAPFTPAKAVYREDAMLTRYILGAIRATVWIYMLRKAYFDKCDIVNTYFIETKGSHEPGYIIPLLAHGGKSKFFPLPLYRFNDSGDGHSQFRDYAHAEGFLNEYDKLNNIALDALPGKVLSAPQKAIYKRMSVFSQCHKLYWEAQKFSASAEQAAISKQLFTYIIEWIGVADSAQADIGRARVITMCWSVINGFLHHAKASSGGARSRTIGYGAMGGAAAYVLPELAGSKLECTELWDASGDGRAIKKPAFETLTKDDRILILPHRIEVENAVLMQAKPSGCQVFTHGQIINLLACERFPAVFDACRKMREVLQ